MLKLEIGFDEEKVLSDGKYKLKDMYNFLDKLFASKRLSKENTANNSVIYIGTDPYHDFGKMFSCIFYLEKQDWFMEYTNVIMFYDGKNREDILSQMREKMLRSSKVI